MCRVKSAAAPVAFGRAGRLKRLAIAFACSLNHKDYWQLEAAAMLSQLGYPALPARLVEKLYYGEQLTADEKTLASARRRDESAGEHTASRTRDSHSRTAERDGRTSRTPRRQNRWDGRAHPWPRAGIRQPRNQGHPVDVAIQTLRRRASRFGARCSSNSLRTSAQERAEANCATSRCAR